MRRLVTVVGARPQFVKASALSRVLGRRASEVLIHSGQHYDASMSAVFFEELGIPAPAHDLAVGSGTHGAQTGAMLTALEPLIVAARPDVVVVYGDTNTTLAAALVAAKLHIPVAHVEAGLRSFNRRMPEEINRVLTDHVSQWLFAPSRAAVEHLAAEGIVTGVHDVGDIMADAVATHLPTALARSAIVEALGLVDGAYDVATVHRAENTDAPARLAAIVHALGALGRPVVLPLHPRTRARLATAAITPAPSVRIIEPLGYLDMLRLLHGAEVVLTDSGGLQKEAFYLGRPCVTLRTETEWTETVACGWNVLVDPEVEALRAAVATMRTPRPPRPALYGDGRAAARIADILLAA